MEKEGGGGVNTDSCATCAHSTPSDYGGWVCVHPELLDSGVVLTVGDDEVCYDWKEIETE